MQLVCTCDLIHPTAQSTIPNKKNEVGVAEPRRPHSAHIQHIINPITAH